MRIAQALSAAVLCGFTLPASAQWAPFEDGMGREWRQVKETVGLSWNQAATVCPTDGVTPCDGTVSGRDLTGWVWATREQVTELFALFAPEILESPSVGGAAYTLSALYFCTDAMLPTYEFYSTYSNYVYVGGLTSTLNPDGDAFAGSSSASWYVYNGSFDLAQAADPAAGNTYTGLWMWRWVDQPCEGDTNADLTVNFDDLNAVLAGWGGSSAAGVGADVDASGTIDFGDLNIVLERWGESCV